MTTSPRSLVTPAVESQTMATARTPRSGHALDLIELTNDAASGHPGQRATVSWCTGGMVYAIVHRDTVARYLRIDLTVASRTSTASSDGVTVYLSVTDLTTTVSPPSTAIPWGLDGTVNFAAAGSGSRAQSMTHTALALDLEDVGFAALDTSKPWVLRFNITADPGVMVENITVREVPRFVVDDARSWGEVPGYALPRAAINSRLPRLQANVHAAVDLNRRTYCHIARSESDPWTTTSGGDAAIPGTLSEGVGVGTKFLTHPRRVVSGNPSVVFGAHYKTSGAGDGTLKLHSVGTGAAYTLTLPATSGAWATVLTGAGALYDADEDSLYWTASVAAGTLSLATLWVCEDP